MPTECNPALFEFGSVEGRRGVAAFDGGAVTSDAGAPLLGATDKALGLIERLASCFRDERRADLVEHRLPTLIGQRVFAMALGYEEVVDHDEVRFDPVLAALSGKLEARRPDCVPGSPANRRSTAWSTRRVTLGRAITKSAMTATRSPNCSSIYSSKRMRRRRARSSSTSMPPMILCMGIKKGRFFHSYYDCCCYLPLYV